MTAFRRVDMWLPWLAGALLAAGLITFLVVRFGNTAGAKETFGTQDAAKPQVVKQVPLEQAARQTAAKFILTAVARKNLDQAWKLATPNIKGGLSHKEWMTGNIPVPTLGVPLDKAAITKIIYSHKNEAELNIVLLPKPNNQRVKSTLVVMDLKKVGTGAKARWLVDYCQVQQGIPVPRPT
jgi:hypothetical protein